MTTLNGDMDSNIQRKFTDPEVLLLQRLVRKECHNGFITENKLNKIYADVFPTVFLNVRIDNTT